MSAECEIYPGEEVRVLDRGIYGEDDIGSLFSGAGGGPATKREREVRHIPSQIRLDRLPGISCCHIAAHLPCQGLWYEHEVFRHRGST